MASNSTVRTRPVQPLSILLALLLVTPSAVHAQASRLEPVKYRNPGLVVDAGVGLWAWPMPMDYDQDGDVDLVVSCPDVPFNGMYLFENPGGARIPVFKAPRRIAAGVSNVQVSYVDGQPRVLAPGREFVDFRTHQLDHAKPLSHIPASIHPGKIRANQWKYVDYDADGRLDLIVGIGDWTEYGWDNAFDSQGNWTRGPLHGYVYLLRNVGDAGEARYEQPVKIEANGRPVDVYGMPSPNFADFDQDGDLDLLCGEFLDGFTYFENIGTRAEPRYAAGRRLMHDGAPLAMDLQMITPTAFDWDGDGDWDLIVGDEDGRIALLENVGLQDDRTPRFLPPVYFRQEADLLKFGALVTPCACDWDDDGDEDLICGNTAGYIGFIENLDGGCPPSWAAPRYLTAGGKPIRIQAGPNGSIQGPCEAKWGYTTLSVADLNGDGRRDIVANSIWGKIIWFENVGSRGQPKLAPAQPVEVVWPDVPPKPAWNWWNPAPMELVTQWRTTPVAVDWDRDGLVDLIMLDHEGYLAFWKGERVDGRPRFQPPHRCFWGTNGSRFDSRHTLHSKDPGPLRLNDGQAGSSGRRKICVADWNGDGRADLLVNSTNVTLLLNDGQPGEYWNFRDAGPIDPRRLAGHTTSPTTVDWNRDGRPELLIGAEDGHFYYLAAP